jgi:hypothetical protein
MKRMRRSARHRTARRAKPAEPMNRQDGSFKSESTKNRSSRPCGLSAKSLRRRSHKKPKDQNAFAVFALDTWPAPKAMSTDTTSVLMAIEADSTSVRRPCRAAVWSEGDVPGVEESVCRVHIGRGDPLSDCNGLVKSAEAGDWGAKTVIDEAAEVSMPWKSAPPGVAAGERTLLPVEV